MELRRKTHHERIDVASDGWQHRHKHAFPPKHWCLTPSGYNFLSKPCRLGSDIYMMILRPWSSLKDTFWIVLYPTNDRPFLMIVHEGIMSPWALSAFLHCRAGSLVARLT